MSHLCSTLCIIFSCIALFALAVTRSTDNVPWWSCKNYNIRLQIDGCQELESSLGHFHLSPHFICAFLAWFNQPSFVQKVTDHFIIDWSADTMLSSSPIQMPGAVPQAAVGLGDPTICVIWGERDEGLRVQTPPPEQLVCWEVQWSLYFKTTHGTKKIWSYIAGGLKIKVI